MLPASTLLAFQNKLNLHARSSCRLLRSCASRPRLLAKPCRLEEAWDQEPATLLLGASVASFLDEEVGTNDQGPSYSDTLMGRMELQIHPPHTHPQVCKTLVIFLFPDRLPGPAKGHSGHPRSFSLLQEPRGRP